MHVGAHQVPPLGRVVVQKVVQPGHEALKVVGAVDQDAGVDQGLLP
ncbi:hypothetical protein OG205_13890 [Lentzea sp. NBC_00516]|nr:hypothetical protein [Lentzea sp. NBC_00516]WUD28040.1 hypothetical protein OG205_13890 [Lentzea sp. NBC_00516]